MSDTTTNDDLNARRRRMIGRLFLRASQIFQDTAIHRIQEKGHTEYRIGDNQVLVHLELAGNRITDLAERAGVTKQAISKVVLDLEQRGVVERTQDPEDGRAKIVRLTAAGETMMMDAFDVVFALDAELTEIIGAERMDIVREALTELLEELDPDGF
ncbi:MAG: MarR family winged helix-turn-helix transcriptional regulator [Myxococcota bacterium]